MVRVSYFMFRELLDRSYTLVPAEARRQKSSIEMKSKADSDLKNSKIYEYSSERTNFRVCQK